MSDIGTLLREYYKAANDVTWFQPRRQAALERLAKLVHMDLDTAGALAVITEAERTAAPDILRGEPDEDLLAALKEVYTVGAEYDALVNAQAAALNRLRAALLAMPDPPSANAITKSEDCEAIAARIVCQEWLARRLTAPLPESAVTDSDGLQIQEVPNA
jgi:hypothetical protein